MPNAILFSAIFARELIRHETGADLIGAFTGVTLSDISEADKGGLMNMELNLCITFAADPGEHVISIGFRETGRAPSTRFTMLSNVFTVELYGKFPLIIDHTINRFPILLDGEPLGTAYLVSYPLYNNE